METQNIAVVNGVQIQCSSDAEKLIPIKPICEALGIVPDTQIRKIKEHPIFSSTTVLSVVVASDEKNREMVCLPIKYIFGWLFTIHPDNVDPQVKELVIKYQMECYDALYTYFTARASFVELKQTEIDRQLSIVDDAKSHFKDAKNILSEAEVKLKQLRVLTMDDFDMERRQLRLEF